MQVVIEANSLAARQAVGLPRHVQLRSLHLRQTAGQGLVRRGAHAGGHRRGTSRIRLGTLVTSPNCLHPVPLTHDVGTLRDITKDRFVLGFGAGSPGIGRLRPRPGQARQGLVGGGVRHGFGRELLVPDDVNDRKADEVVPSVRWRSATSRSAAPRPGGG
ncbi:LLM class flavin-dependent oxidoreductase [Streptomyces alboflavus]|uniref:LLM class flavin-dependent oxidoreductase n=1 Tax=Streptomyces alboflavus TaxID=67267 RepID=UPI0036B9321A